MMSRSRKRGWAAMVPVFIVIVLVIGQQRGWLGARNPRTANPSGTSNTSTTSTAPPTSGAGAIEAAFRLRRSDVWVEASGVVVKSLPDDRQGEPHQKMLVRIDGGAGITVLIAHNLSAAARVPAREGDRIRFRGEYEWTDKGGTIHFTHAPELQRREPGGWVEFESVRYE
jgi:hypothetical protein